MLLKLTEANTDNRILHNIYVIKNAFANPQKLPNPNSQKCTLPRQCYQDVRLCPTKPISQF